MKGFRVRIVITEGFSIFHGLEGTIISPGKHTDKNKYWMVQLENLSRSAKSYLVEVYEDNLEIISKPK